uniref:Uncharacterized protein n=1 Tax=Strigops habroptila TaxID=2489341 RepID=A0A672TQR7_STRHB
MPQEPEGQGCPLCPMLSSYESLSDNQVEDLGEAIPFSLNSMHSHMVKDEGEKNRIYAEKLAEYAQELEEEAQESQTPFYKDMKRLGSLSEDEEHSWACRFPVHQRSHILRTASMASCGSYDSFHCSTGNHLGIDAFVPWAHASDPYLGYPECTKGAEPHMLYEEAIGDRQFPSLQLTNDMLREENTMIRRVVKSMQSSMKSQVWRECPSSPGWIWLRGVYLNCLPLSPPKDLWDSHHVITVQTHHVITEDMS